jgi:hypothetical protein
MSKKAAKKAAKPTPPAKPAEPARKPGELRRGDVVWYFAPVAKESRDRYGCFPVLCVVCGGPSRASYRGKHTYTVRDATWEKRPVVPRYDSDKDISVGPERIRLAHPSDVTPGAVELSDEVKRWQVWSS